MRGGGVGAEGGIGSGGEVFWRYGNCVLYLI